MFEELYDRFIKGRLEELCTHNISNFVAQAAIAFAKTPAQVQGIFQELSPLLTNLLQKRRGGVVAALMAACGRLDRDLKCGIPHVHNTSTPPYL